MNHPTKKIICIDPGHGGADPGAVNGGRHEAVDNLRLALAAGYILKQQGHTAVLTHRGDIPAKSRLLLEARRRIALESKADLFISLHRNSFKDPAANGIEIWIRSAAYAKAAAQVLGQVAAVEHQANRGVKTGNYAVLYNMPMPAMMLELGFISNAKDNELFDKHFDGTAAAVAKGILAVLGVPKPEFSSALYRVQVGAFSVRENAERLREELMSKGYPSFIVKAGA